MEIIYSAIGLSFATIIGSLIGFRITGLPHKWNDTVLGFCAGVMLAASTVGLILPAVDMTTGWGMMLVVAGVAVGAMFLNLLDLVTPHMHTIVGVDPEQHANNKTIDRILLFVMAIALHKMPEGMAAGVVFNDVSSDGSAIAVSLGIALQNIPEGMVVISPLLLAGVKRGRVFVISLVIALLEVVGMAVGYLLGGISEAMLPFMLSFAGGAMLYVVSDEMIPETHAHGYQKPATYALLGGFVMLVVLDRIMG